MAPSVELQINNSRTPAARFVTWAPSPCRIRVTNPSGARPRPTVSVQLTERVRDGGGAVVFRKGTTGSFTNTSTLPVPDQRHLGALLRRRQVSAGRASATET